MKQDFQGSTNQISVNENVAEQSSEEVASTTPITHPEGKSELVSSLNKKFPTIKILLIFGGIVLVLFWQRVLKPTQEKQSMIMVPSPTPESQEIRQVQPTCLDETTVVTLNKGGDEMDGNITVTKENESTGETRDFTITGVIERHAHFLDIHRCYLYVKRLVDNGNTELWRYNFNGYGEVIYTSPSEFDFDINDPEELLAIDTDLEVVVLEIESGRVVRQVLATQLKSFLNDTPPHVLEVLGIELRGWNTDSSELWGSLWAAAYVEAFWKLDINTGEIEVFSGFDAPSPNGVALNPDKEVYAYSDKPLFFDVESFEEWQKENSSYSLYIYSLRDKSSVLVDTLPSSWSPGMLSPLRGWDSPIELRYSTPSGDKIYTLKE